MGISARGRWLRQLENFERLQWLRDGFGDDHRGPAVMVLAIVFRGLRLDDGEIRRRVGDMAAKCRPPLDERQQSHAIAATAEYRAMDSEGCNYWFSQLLDVTDYEAEFLTGWVSAAVARHWAEVAARGEIIPQRPDRTVN